MEIITLLKANIRKKKSTFISIMLLTIIIVTTMTAIFSVRDNYGRGIKKAFEYSDCGDTKIIIEAKRLTDEVKKTIENNTLVDRVEYMSAIGTKGTRVGEKYDGNTYFMVDNLDGIQLFNENLDGFESSIPKLKSGEIYLPLGLKSKLECNVGDTIRLYLLFDNYAEFVIKGFVQEPSQGALNMGWKQVFISNEDYDRLYADCSMVATEEVIFDFVMLNIYQSAESELSVAKFQRQLNLETGIVDIGIGALNKDQSIKYTKMMTDIIFDIVLVFIALLFVIILIVMSHNISTEIEIDYVTLGVLKSQGFSKGKIRIIIMLQYLFAEISGIIVGSILAIPIERRLSTICQSITAILPDRGLSIGKSLLCMMIILSASILLIFIKTLKVAKISPVRAISGGREEIFFDSRLNLPVTKKGLSASLSLRQFTSAKKRYFGTVFIVAILAFSMITVNLIGNLLSSRSALEAMGMIVADLEVYYTERNDTDCWKDIEGIIEAHSEIEKKNGRITGYASLNGENLYCEIFECPEYINGIIKGREPIYDNEIMITEMVADMLELKIGDEATVTFLNGEDVFIITGFYQSGNDGGASFATNFEGATKLGCDVSTAYRYYVIKDKEKAELIAEEISERYGEFLGVEVYDEEDNEANSQFGVIVSALKLLIYTFSILFALVVVRMVCTKSFVQERRDIGIYKALGFTSRKLRISFAIRFMIIALTGSALGVGLSALFSAKMLSLALGLMGLSEVILEFNLVSVLLPIIVMSCCFFIFAYFASGKIKRVAVRELVVE